jgi:hypothetical protein
MIARVQERALAEERKTEEGQSEAQQKGYLDEVVR